MGFKASKLKKSVRKQKPDAIAEIRLAPAIGQVKINGRSAAERHHV
ncbi:MAG: hypothetical protein M3N42_14135 [Cyanobacteriota bacterium]|nr:hypothetical protein [Cyanobacteriota bacterium]